MTAHGDSRKAIEQLLGPGGFEVSCEQCFELLDRFVEIELAGEDPEASVPGMRAHLTGCPACHEDYESLRALVIAVAAGGYEDR